MLGVNTPQPEVGKDGYTDSERANKKILTDKLLNLQKQIVDLGKRNDSR